MPPTQSHRNLAIETPLGPDVLLLKSFSLQERLGSLFQIEADMVSSNAKINFDQVVGQNATIRVELTKTGQTRFLNGFISRFTQTHADSKGASYRATLVPWLWFLTRTADCRIFQQMTVPDIIQKVWRDRGFTDFQVKLSGQHTPWVYCVQYRETDFNFVSRLMEQEGIYYFFEHQKGRHVLVMADSESAHQPFPGYATIKYREESRGLRDEETISHWTLDQQVQPGTYALKDFNFEKPKVDLSGKSQIPRGHAYSEFEIYDYPGEYEEKSHGDDYSQIRIQELQAQQEVAQGHGNARGISAGCTFTLQDHLRPDQNRAYLITSASTHVSGDSFEGVGGSGSGEFLSCSFTAIDAQRPYRAPRVTPKPLIQGPQTAMVVGPKGQEIYVDDHARVKLQFHWDRYGHSDENASCWVRVSQAWGGQGFGGMAIPRIGHEVIVEFEEGDPDRPIITGRVYNAASMPNPSNAGRKTAAPTSMKQAAMMTSFKSNSTPGGGGHNEITMNDSKGAEGLYLRAQKDEIHHVLHNREDNVDNNETRVVGVDRSREVGNNETVSVGVNRSVTVGVNHTETVGANQSITVGANKTETIAIACAETIGAAKALTIGAAYQVSVGAVMNETVGAAKMVQVALTSSETVGQTSSLKAKKITLTADEEIIFKTGSAQITMKKNGDISIKGKNIKIKGSKIEEN